MKDSTKRDMQQTVVLETIIQSSDNTIREHVRTWDEMFKVFEEAAKLRQDILKELYEIKTLIRDARRSGEEQQRKLKGKGRRKSASYVAKEIMYSHLMVSKISELQRKNLWI